LPKLETLGLANNRLANLGDLEPLAACVRLLRLDLTGNPVAKLPQYRLYLISKLPQLKLLDYVRVRPVEREAAAAAFGGAAGAERAAALAAESAAAAARADAAAGGGGLGGDERRTAAPTPQQLLALKAAIAGAATLEQVSRLEKALAAGVLPAQLQDGDGAMEEG